VKLTELEPRWYGVPGRRGLGLTFRCPGCRKQRLGVPFANPRDGLAPSPQQPGGPLWQRTGDTFETLTLSPSIDASVVRRESFHAGPEGDAAFAEANRPCTAGGQQHWHGFVQGGEVR
jgi:hypothetical protein